MPPVFEDRDEIHQLLYRYNHAFDSGAADACANTFVEDGVFEAGERVVAGRAALMSLAGGVGSGIRHILSNPVIDVVGDNAHSSSYVVVLREGVVASVGIYNDQLVRTEAGWRFVKRSFTPD